MMADELDMGEWKADDMIRGNGAPNFGGYDGTINPSAMETSYEFTDKSMENDFDFESAASSPSAFGLRPVDMESPEMPTIKHDTPRKNNPAVKTKFKNHNKANSVSLDGMIRITELMIFVATFGDSIYERSYNCWI
jgi:hypothetical protein